MHISEIDLPLREKLSLAVTECMRKSLQIIFLENDKAITINGHSPMYTYLFTITNTHEKAFSQTSLWRGVTLNRSGLMLVPMEYSMMGVLGHAPPTENISNKGAFTCISSSFQMIFGGGGVFMNLVYTPFHKTLQHVYWLQTEYCCTKYCNCSRGIYTLC